MGLREVNERLKRLAKKPKLPKQWRGYPAHEITEEQAINTCRILHETGELNGKGGGFELLSSIIGDELAVEYYNNYLCSDDSYIRAWYD